MKQSVRTYFMQGLILGMGLLCLNTAFAQEILTERGELPGQETASRAWGLQLNTAAYKSLAEYTDWVGSLEAEVSYNRFKDINFQASLEYEGVLDTEYSVDEETRYGIQDLELRATYRDLLKGPIRSLKPLAIAYLPTSETSQNATMVTTVGGGVGFSQKERFFNWGSSHLILGSIYQYETANAFGTAYNSPYGFSNGVNISRTFGKVNLVGSYSIYTYYTYADSYKNLQTFLASANWLINSKLTLTGYYRWRDDIVSYLSAFDDDTSRAGLSLTYTM